MSVPTAEEIAAAKAVLAAVAAPVVTLGQSIDARVAKLEAAAKTDWVNVKSFVSKNWAHAVTWVALAWTSGVLPKLLKL